MQKAKKAYNINQSPLYKLQSRKQLSKVLGIERPTLEKILNRGDTNYYCTQLKNSRKLQIPKPQLKRLHIRLNNLLSRIETPSYIHSGVKGRSNISNAKLHASNTAMVKVDIKNFYSSTTQAQIDKHLRKQFKCSADVAKTIAKLCTVNGHLPTGSPISQTLAFYTNRGVFNHINHYASSRGLIFTLYVDDLTFSGNVIPKHFIDYITSYLKRERGYKCHKIKRYRSSTTKIVTGTAIVDGKLKVQNKHRKNIHDLLSIKSKHIDIDALQTNETAAYYQSLIGHLFSAGQINGRYYQQGKLTVIERKNLKVPTIIK